MFGFVLKHRCFPFGEREGDWGQTECVGCNLCKLLCPVENCITMEVHRVAPEYLN
jgi:formate hydrogenlyase subunit 6/NADH:ubiquinone oxidoreductase subunit I